jgi:hypothetical protein
MSRKTIAFQMPEKNNDDAPMSISAAPGTSIDQWVHHQEKPGERFAGGAQDAAASSLTITLSTMPNWYDVVRIGVLPYLMVWMWTLRATQESLRLLAPRDGGHSNDAY